jgi:hypothetical protein
VWDSTNEGFLLAPRVMYDKPFHAVYTQTGTKNPNEFNYLDVGTPDSSYVNPLVGVSDFGPFPPTMTGRNAFIEPGIWNVDLAVHKNFRLTERFSLQLRAETFNLFNHSNLWIVYSNTDVGSFPEGTNAVTANRGFRNDNAFVGSPPHENRNVQLAVKLIF